MKTISVLREIDHEPDYGHEEAGWVESEIEGLRGYLAGLKTPEAKLEKINLYLSEEKHVSHNIPDRLLWYAVDYYQHREYEKRHPEVTHYDLNDKQLKELAALSETFNKSIQDEIGKLGIFGYYEKIRDEVFKCEKYQLPGNIRILDYLYNERKVLLLEIKQDGEGPLKIPQPHPWLERFSEGLSIEPGRDEYFLQIVNHYNGKSFSFNDLELMKGKIMVTAKDSVTWIICFFEVLETEGIIVNLTGKHNDLEGHCTRIVNYFTGKDEDFNKGSLKNTLGKRKNSSAGERYRHANVDVIRAEIKKLSK